MIMFFYKRFFFCLISKSGFYIKKICVFVKKKLRNLKMKRIFSKLIIVFLSFILLINASETFSQAKCHWSDDKSNEYDLSSLKKADFWKVKDGNGDSGLFAMDYLFNFCQTVSQKCKNTYVGALEALEVLGQLTETCEVLGKNEASEQTIAHIDSNKPDLGLKITYSNGDTCTGSENPIENGKSRKVSFLIYCADHQSTEFVQTKINSNTITKCSLEFSIKSPAGCHIGYGTSSLKKSAIILLWVLVLFIIYSVLGLAYNVKYKGKNGIEAFPNIGFWREFPGLVKDGIKFSCDKMSVGMNFAKNKMNQKSSSGSGYAVV